MASGILQFTAILPSGAPKKGTREAASLPEGRWASMLGTEGHFQNFFTPPESRRVPGSGGFPYPDLQGERLSPGSPNSSEKKNLMLIFLIVIFIKDRYISRFSGRLKASECARLFMSGTLRLMDR